MPVMVNFRQIMSGIDVRPLLEQIAANPQLWNIDDAWSRAKGPNCVLYAVNNIVLRYLDPSPPNLPKRYNRQAFGILSAAQRIVFDFMRALPGEFLGKVIISRMSPGETISPHIDLMPPGVLPLYQRYQIPLSVKPGVVFQCGDEQLFMSPGTAWWFNNQIMHSVVNNSDSERISMLCDIRPFKAYADGNLPADTAAH